MSAALLASPVYLTTAKAASRIGVHPETLRRWRRSGHGPRYLRLGNGTRSPVHYLASDLDEWCLTRRYSHTSQEQEVA